MKSVGTFESAQLRAPTAELRGMLAEMRREIDILRRRDAIREEQLHNLRTELDHAARIQRQIAGELPAIKKASLRVFTHPADRVSGDFHFARRTGPGRVTLAVADATGHGLSAGLIATTIQGALGQANETGWNGVKALGQLNAQLVSYAFSECEFVTAVLAEYDETTRVLHWVRAGGPPPVLIREGEAPRRLMSRGMPLGIEADCTFEPAEIQLQPGDALLLHTDGLETLHTRLCGSRDDNQFIRWIATRTGTLDQHFLAGRMELDDITSLVLRLDA